jgi:hypothetical protein
MRLRTYAASGILLATLALLAGCQSEKKPAVSPQRAALPTMERVAVAANTCWFKSNDPAFRDYRLAPELNSFSGRPRILAVPRHSPARLDAFGPLMDGPAGGRIKSDVLRWAAGGTGC